MQGGWLSKGTLRLPWLPSVLLSIVFILSTLSLWRLHCETLRTKCKVCLSHLWDVSIFQCAHLCHIHETYQSWQKGFVFHKSIYTPASCDVSVYQYHCTALQLADVFWSATYSHQVFLHCFLPSQYLTQLKTSFDCPRRAESMIGFLNTDLWALVLRSENRFESLFYLQPFLGGKLNENIFLFFHSFNVNFNWAFSSRFTLSGRLRSHN